MTGGDEMSNIHDSPGEAAAYVLGALEPAEALAFSKHLEECVVCRDEVEALRGVVHALPMAAPQRPVPRRLRRRVMGAIRQEPRQSAEPRQRGWRALAGVPPRVSLGALATVLIAAAVVGGIAVSGPGSQVRLVQAHVTGVSGTADLRLVGGRGELIVNHLSPPPPGHVYEVWLKSPRRPPAPASVLFSVNSSGGADVGLPDSLAGITQVMVTPEPAGGSLAPTHAPVIVAQLT